jgi:hypothetical protein
MGLWKYSSNIIDHGTNGVIGRFYYPAASPHGKFSGTHWTGDTVGPRTGLDAVKKRNLNLVHPGPSH